jgi:hypothetical protein
MTAPLVITRYVKRSGVLVAADGIGANLYPSKLTNIRKLNCVITPIPGEQHLGIPIGPEVKEITIDSPWNMNNNPCSTKTYQESLKNWTCNSIYGIVPSGSLIDEVDGTPGYFLAKSISTVRDKTGMAGAVNRWDLNMNLVKIRDEDVTDCPDFEDTTVSNTSVSTGSPVLTLTTTQYTNQTVDLQLTKIQVKHVGAVQAFPLYDEPALTVLPPLGNTGPVIDIDFRLKSVADYQMVKSWAATRSTMVTVDEAIGYPEFDIDNAPTYWSRWIVSSINVNRSPGSGGAFASNIV